jgi:hypothetical protein
MTILDFITKIINVYCLLPANKHNANDIKKMLKEPVNYHFWGDLEKKTLEINIFFHFLAPVWFSVTIFWL